MEQYYEIPKILMVGLDESGKTTLLYRCKLDEIVETIPTIGFNCEDIILQGGKKAYFWDIGGMKKLRFLWHHYYGNL